MIQPGKVLCACHDGAYVLKLEGDVRLTFVATLDEFLLQMFSDPKFLSVLIDLTDTAGIDSTTLGILAKLSIQAQERFNFLPVVFSTNPDITRILESMGFDQVFNIVNDNMETIADLGELPLKEGTEDEIRTKIIEAHRILMDLNADNQLTFKDVVQSLESR